MSDDERAELIAAITQLALGAEQVLSLTEQLLAVIESGNQRLPSELTDARSQVIVWREQIDRLKLRVGGLTIEPPKQPQ